MQPVHDVGHGQHEGGAVLVLQLARNVENGEDAEPAVLLHCCRRWPAMWSPGMISTRGPPCCRCCSLCNIDVQPAQNVKRREDGDAGLGILLKQARKMCNTWRRRKRRPRG